MKTSSLLLFLLLSLPLLATTRRYRLMFNNDPSTEITVGWEQQSGSNPVVYFDTVDHGTDYMSYANSQTPYRQVNYMGMDNRFAKLTNLQPNTVYYFLIWDSEGTSQRYWFRTCPNTNTETLSFISGGDSRSGYTQRQNSNRMVAKIRPHAVLFGGDLVNIPSIISIQDWLDHWQLTITSDNQMIPLVHSYGNHENYGFGGSNLIFDLFDTPFDVYYNVKFGGDLFSMYTLNGELLPGHEIEDNARRIAQRNWLNAELPSDNSIWKAAQYHRPIVPHYSGKGEGADEFNDWVSTFYDNGVRLIMESDAHVVKMTEEVKPAMATASGNSSNWFTTSGIDPDKGITFIGEGIWGTIRTPDDSHPMTTAMGSFYGFNWLLVNSCRIEIRTIDTQNPGAVPEHAAGDYTSISSGLENQVWKPAALPTGVRTITKCFSPIVDFAASQTTIFTGGTIDFTDLSSNSPTSWSWNFGDGGMSNQQNPSYSYSTPGTYTVTLAATNQDGTTTESKLGYITVITPTSPVADFTSDITTAAVGQSIFFTDLSSGAPDSWIWDFGDGYTSTLQNPEHIYAATGTYDVSLTVTNLFGPDMEIKNAYITVTNGGAVTITIAGPNDDAEEYRDGTGEMYLTSSDLEIGNDLGTEQYVGVRFQNVPVGQGATISSAYLRMRGDEIDLSSSQLNIYIAGEGSDNAPGYSNSYFDISNRNFTTAQYTWPDGSIPGWDIGTWYDLPDITPVVQEIVDRPGWASGNAMAFMLWSDLGESSERVADSYEGGHPAELVLEFTMPVPTVPVANFVGAPTVCTNHSYTLMDFSSGNPDNWDWVITGPETFTSNDQNPVFTFTTPGVYDVELYVSGPGGSDTLIQTGYITVDGCAGLEDISMAGYTIYPNPSDDVIYIERDDSAEKAEIRVYDTKGKLVYSVESSDNPITVDVSLWETGIYTVKLSVDGKEFAKKLLIR